MKYREYTFVLTPATEAAQDILADLLAGIGFDSFVHPGALDLPTARRTDDPEAPVITAEGSDDRLLAYIPTAADDAAAVDVLLADFPLPGVTIAYTATDAEDKDWNEEWEKNYFQPLTVDGRCVIAGTFHKDVPKAEYNILINPQMSFGTGHHATTSQMISRILEDPMEGLDGLDMGCGTSILAILARMRGARHCVAVDYDEWCVKNSLENIALNHIDGIDVHLGDAGCLADKGPFDLIIANINRNILVRDMHLYVPRMKDGATLYTSGFYTADIPAIRAEAERLGLTLVDSRHMDDWACVKFVNHS